MGKVNDSVTTMGVKKKLKSSCGFESFTLSLLGREYYHVLIDFIEKQSVEISHGPIMLYPWFFRVLPWVQDFDPFNQKMSHTLVWLWIYGLPVEYRRPANLLNISRGVDFPWRIDPLTINKYNKLYARAQIEVDCSSSLPDKILMKRSGQNCFVHLEYEDLPDFCISCVVLADNEVCKFMNVEEGRYRENVIDKGQYVN